MKNKILTFIIGVLVGAIISTIGFLVYNKSISNNTNQPEMMQSTQNGQMMEAPQDGNGEEPPAKPEESNSNTINN